MLGQGLPCEIFSQHSILIVVRRTAGDLPAPADFSGGHSMAKERFSELGVSDGFFPQADTCQSPPWHWMDPRSIVMFWEPSKVDTVTWVFETSW